MNASTTRTSGIAVLGFLLLTSGCVSQQTLKDYQDEVRSLREERTQLKKENRQLRMQNESYEVALAEANTMLVEEPEALAYDELDALGIDYRNQGGNFVISIPASITFGSGKAALTNQGQQALTVVAQTLLRDYGDGFFWIEGHTDSDPIRKSSWDSNRDLSVARAMEVLHFLVESAGIPDDQCVVAGHGQYSPMAANDDEAGKARNRRVEIVVHRPQA